MKFKNIKFWALFIIINPLLQVCAFDNNKTIKTLSNTRRDTSITISGTRCDILFPHVPSKGTILVLPGWNFSCDDICKRSNFCRLAANDSFTLVMPDMLKSIYATKLYPETRKDWSQYHTLYWITDTLIIYVQKHFNLLKPKQDNYLFGISTGARGVAMLAIYSEKIFIAGAGLSGDYNQLTMKYDNLVCGYYGSYENFPERWSGTDNPLLNAEKIKIPLFLAHGKSDNIEPLMQTIEFYNKISKISPNLGHELNLKENTSHNYEFWSSEYPSALNFFRKHRLKQ